MNVFNNEISLTKGKASFEKSLNERLVDLNQQSMHIFPFAFFTKAFYRDFKQSRKGVFTGKINGDKFEIIPSSKIFSTRTWFPLRIVGIIENQKIRVGYIIPNWILGIIIILPLIDLIVLKNEMKFNGILIVFAVVIILSYVYKIIRNNRIMQNI
ncbi:hypothetical protein ACUNWD_20750 [Sunxiuqinia sp. A32]|uniref:hypothetical protein n=1 Tax=Sunxiuqinia sp. A32 TaxID=3461496 RepID=UPI00404617E5